MRRNVLIILFALALAGGYWLLSIPEGLNEPARRALGVFGISLFLWVTQLLPMSATGLLAIALVSLCGIMSPDQAFSYFGNSAVFFLMGVFLLTAAMIKTGLSKRATLLFIKLFDRSPRFLLFGILVVSMSLSMLMPEHAVAAMMFPVVHEIARVLELKPHSSSYGKALFLAMAWGAVIGGTTTFLGGARAPLAVGLLTSTFGMRITFVEWTTAALPVVVMMIIPAYLVLAYTFRMDVKDVHRAKVFLEQELARIGRPSAREARLGILMIATILTWILAGHSLSLANVAILAAVGLFVFRIVSWSEVEEYVNWGVIVMYGGAITVGKALTETKAVEWLASHVLETGILPPFGAVVFLMVASILLTEAISNVATVAVILPLGFGLVESFHLHPIMVVFAVTIPAGLPFCLPIGTPPNAIAYSSGFFTISENLRRGLVLNALALTLLVLIARFYWPSLSFMQWP